MIKRRLFLGAVALGVACFACQVVAGIRRVEQVDAPVEDAGVAETSPPEASTGDPCAHVLPPPMPADDDDPNTSVPDFYLALRSVTLLAANGAPLGFDLDGVCSCDGRPLGANDGGQSCVGTQPFCDADGGVDNQIATFAKLFDITNPANVNRRIATGQQTSIVVIKRYNGRPNDRDVGFGIFTSEGIPAAQENPGCADVGSADGYLFPGWCGKDRWTVSEASVTAMGGGRFTPKSVGVGYVTNYRFVVSLLGAADVPFAGYRLALGSAISTGLLVPLGPQLTPLDTSAGPPPRDQIAFWRLDDGVIAGRVPTNEVLAAVGILNDPGTDAAAPSHVCANPLLLAALKSEICNQPDINATSTLDFTAGAACNALSAAVGVTGGPVELDGLVSTKPNSNDCAPNPDGGNPVAHPTVIYRCP